MTALGFSPNAHLLFTASRSLQLRCWSLDGGAPAALRSYKGHKAPVADMAVHASGGLLATGSADRTVRVWDVDGGFCTHSFTGHRQAVGTSAAAQRACSRACRCCDAGRLRSPLGCYSCPLPSM